MHIYISCSTLASPHNTVDIPLYLYVPILSLSLHGNAAVDAFNRASCMVTCDINRPKTLSKLLRVPIAHLHGFYSLYKYIYVFMFKLQVYLI